MNLPDHVPIEEVKRVCRELKIRDWILLKRAEVLPEEAKTILAELETGKMKIADENFQRGLEVELDAGFAFLSQTSPTTILY